jgi:hypothetical protein
MEQTRFEFISQHLFLTIKACSKAILAFLSIEIFNTTTRVQNNQQEEDFHDSHPKELRKYNFKTTVPLR